MHSIYMNKIISIISLSALAIVLFASMTETSSAAS